MNLTKIKKVYKAIIDYFVGFCLKRLNSKKRFEMIYKLSYWKSFSNDSISGAGSEIKTTENIRKNLNKFLLDYKIKSMLDAPCGDFNWMSKIELNNIQYTGADIVEKLIKENLNKYKSKNINFINLDLVNSKLDYYDLIFNRDCLVHLNNEEIFRILKNVKNSNSLFFASTIFENNYNNNESKLDDLWRPINLTKDPFNLPEPLSLLNDESETIQSADKYKKIAIWKVKDL